MARKSSVVWLVGEKQPSLDATATERRDGLAHRTVVSSTDATEGTGRPGVARAGPPT